MPADRVLTLVWYRGGLLLPVQNLRLIVVLSPQMVFSNHWDNSTTARDTRELGEPAGAGREAPPSRRAKTITAVGAKLTSDIRQRTRAATSPRIEQRSCVLAHHGPQSTQLHGPNLQPLESVSLPSSTTTFAKALDNFSALERFLLLVLVLLVGLDPTPRHSSGL